MKEFKDKVAVITGAASGIGRGIAERCVQEEMKVVLADIEKAPLAATEADLKATGATVLAVPTDVSKAKDIEILAQTTYDSFGAVHLLVNNAGVEVLGALWECTVADWEWVLGVNLWGVIHGIRVFVPRMLAQNTDGYIINTASGYGLFSAPNVGIYTVTKHGVMTLSETLYKEFKLRGAKLKVSVLIPGLTKTRMMDAERNRPEALQDAPDAKIISEDAEKLEQDLRTGIENAMSPQQLADIVFNAIRTEKFYILGNPRIKQRVQTRMEDILKERNPTLPTRG